MLVIINADDLGMDVARNDLTFHLMSQGRITSATILANGPAVDHAIKNVRFFPKCSFGIHLNATEFRPIRNHSSLRPLVNDGIFSRNIRLTGVKWAVLKGLYQEFCAQVDRLLEAGIQISHIDSHHHLHTLPSVLPVVKGIQRRYGIRSVRISQTIYAPGYAASHVRRAKAVVYNSCLRHLYGTKTTDAFTEFQIFCQACKIRTWHFRTVELMVHPGNPLYDAETNLLGRASLEELLGPVQKITYFDL